MALRPEGSGEAAEAAGQLRRVSLTLRVPSGEFCGRAPSLGLSFSLPDATSQSECPL